MSLGSCIRPPVQWQRSGMILSSWLKAAGLFLLSCVLLRRGGSLQYFTSHVWSAHFLGIGVRCTSEAMPSTGHNRLVRLLWASIVTFGLPHPPLGAKLSAHTPAYGDISVTIADNQHPFPIFMDYFLSNPTRVTTPTLAESSVASRTSDVSLRWRGL